ncbi:MAG: NAD(P)/FAD-dependent oxidoreductase [Myxococcota bacterium]|nr:NAD(P)/FAD-dependent oxidoreductase [Myxococcota bacterium]
MHTPHLVIIGGGFGGLATAQALASTKLRVTLVDRRNHHLFQPLLYQVATASLAPTDISVPIRAVLSKEQQVSVRLGEVESIDPQARKVHLRGQTGQDTLDYDYLVVATGVRHAYFGHPEWSEDAPGLKTVADALEIRRRVLTAFEQAEWEQDPKARERLLTFVVVGGGPTGVELAGALAEISVNTLRKDFRNIDTRQARVLLVEAGPSLLGAFDPELQEEAKTELSALGVELRFGTPVTQVTSAGVRIGEDMLPAATVLWAAGVSAGALLEPLGERDRAGRVMVAPDCSVPEHPNVFVIGDAAHLKQADGVVVPGLAPAAVQMGRHAARCIEADLAGKERRAFAYRDKGSMATIGRNKAVLQSGKVRMSGRLAWLAWVFVHLWELVNFRDRVSVFLKWAWAWWTWDRAGRLLWDPHEGEAPQRTPDQDQHRGAA